MFTAYYDLSCCPASFDVVTFLLRVEQERLHRGDDAVHIEILPGPNGGFRQDDLWPQSQEMRRQLLHKVAVPMCAMLPSCGRIVVLHETRGTPKPDGFGLNQYLISFKHFIAAIGRGIRPLRPQTERSRNSRLVTMTLRECEHWPERNSRVLEWHRAALNLHARGFEVVVIRDTAKYDVGFGDGPGYFGKLGGPIPISPIASCDLEIRARYYRQAACNMFVSNGPGWFAMALDAPVIVMRPATEGIGPLYGARAYELMGVPPGGQFPGAPDHQRLVWEDDTADNIVEACCAFMNAREQRSAA